MTVKNESDRSQLYTPEENAKRFKRVAERRVNRIINDLRLLGNTSNKSLYRYEEAEIEKIFSTIDRAITETRGKFRSRSDKNRFRLD